MVKLLVIEAVQTNDMYGYNAISIENFEANFAIIRNLKEKFDEVKKIDSSINRITYYSVPFECEVLNEEFQATENAELIEMSEEDYAKFTDFENNCYSVNSPLINISEMGLQIVWHSKYTSDEVYNIFGWDNFK